MEQVLTDAPLAELDETRATSSPVVDLPSPAAMGRATLGFLALGVTAALGGDGGLTAANLAPSGLLVQAGAMVLTGPAMLVGHQFLGLEASVPSLVNAMAGAFVRTGTVALGLVPAVLYFSATSGLGPFMFGMAMVGMGLNGLFDATAGMRTAELQAGEGNGALRDAKMTMLALGWAGLTGLIGLRIAFHLGGA